MIALDAKVSFDENAEFRHKNWDDLRDLSEEEDTEIRAKETGLSYVKLDGNIGCFGQRCRTWQWQPWTSSNSTVENLRTSSMSAAAQNEEQVKTAFSIIL